MANRWSEEDGWSAEEIGLLSRYAGQRHWVEQVQSQLPGRSENALRTKMTRLRKTMALPKSPCGRGRCQENDNWEADIPHQTAALLEATLRVGVWS